MGSNHEVYKFRGWWILTYFIFGLGESSSSHILNMVNLKRTCVLLFYYFLCLKVNLDLVENKSLICFLIIKSAWAVGESSPN